MLLNIIKDNYGPDGHIEITKLVAFLQVKKTAERASR